MPGGPDHDASLYCQSRGKRQALQRVTLATALLHPILHPMDGLIQRFSLAIPAMGWLVLVALHHAEGVAAVRAAAANRMQTCLNLALGSARATIGLTIPSVALVSFWLDLPLTLGLDPKGIVLLTLTLFVVALSLARGRTTMLHGAAHLAIFGAYIILTILP